MYPSTRSIPGATLALVVSLVSNACLDQDTTTPIVAPDFAIVGAPGHADALSVYTQNLWLGGDTGPLFTLDLTDTSPAGIGALIQATSTFWAEVQASDVPVRAARIVDEIESLQPDVVGLQEAVGYASGTLSFAGVFTASAAGPDLLLAVMTEIGTRGLPYSMAVMQPTTAIALPVGPPGAGGFPALAVQDRVVMLVHDDIADYDTDQGLYDARIPLGPVDFVRGWVRVSTQIDGVLHHFVATHLETQAARAIQESQSSQLREEILAGLDGVTVLLGDLNSDAEADPSAPSYTATYGDLLADGFRDAWSNRGRGSNVGATCCWGPDRTPDQRIDFVLVRSTRIADDKGRHRGWFSADLVGASPDDQISEGLWPSDHVGLVATIDMPDSMR